MSEAAAYDFSAHLPRVDDREVTERVARPGLNRLALRRIDGLINGDLREIQADGFSLERGDQGHTEGADIVVRMMTERGVVNLIASQHLGEKSLKTLSIVRAGRSREQEVWAYPPEPGTVNTISNFQAGRLVRQVSRQARHHLNR